MATAATRQDNPVITEIQRMGFDFTLEPQLDLSDLSKTRRVQVREEKHYAPLGEVLGYAAQMAYSQFPPVIVTRDHWLVDGNTRVGACLKRGQKFFPAYVLDVEYERTSQKQKEELHALALTLNQMNGRRLTSKEQIAEAKRLIGLGWKTDQIQRAAGIPAGKVTMARKELDADTRLAKVGMSTNGELKDTTKRVLGHRAVQALNDEPFRQLTQLAVDAGLKQSEVVDLAKEAKEAGSDEAGAQVLENARAAQGERIRQKVLTGNSVPPVSSQLRQKLGFLVQRADSPASMVEHNPDLVEQHKTALKQAQAVLGQVLELQDAR